MEAEEGRVVEVIDIDLNEEPAESLWNYGEQLNYLENMYLRIEERIRRLEAVTTRAREREESRVAVDVVNEEETLSLTEHVEEVQVNELPLGRLDSLKRSNNHLLALALETNGDVQVKKNTREAFFDCNICFRKAREPILTCCGHLFCWPCFYLLPDVGDVSDTGIIPIYGNNDKALKMDADKSGLTIPPRPQAKRIESLRQQRITRGSQSIRIDEVLRSLQSFSTLSNNLTSVLNSAERIAEDIGGITYLYHPVGQRYQSLYDDDNSNSAVLVDVPPAEAIVPDPNADTETDLPPYLTPIIEDGASSASNDMQPNAVVLLPPQATSPWRRINSQELFTDLPVRRLHRGMLRRTFEQTQAQHLLHSRAEEQEQRRSSLRSRIVLQSQVLQQLSGIFQSEVNPADALPLVDDPELLPVRVVTSHSSNVHTSHETVYETSESNMFSLPSSVRRREYVIDTSEASGSETPEPEHRRRRHV